MAKRPSSDSFRGGEKISVKGIKHPVMKKVPGDGNVAADHPYDDRTAARFAETPYVFGGKASSKRGVEAEG